MGYVSSFFAASGGGFFPILNTNLFKYKSTVCYNL